MLQKIAIVPLVLLALLVLAALWLPVTAPVVLEHPPQYVPPANRLPFHAIADAGNVNPDDFCKELNKALALAGAKQMCFGSTFVKHGSHLAEIRFVDIHGDTMAQIDLGVDSSNIFEDYKMGLPSNKTVYSSAIRVYRDFEGQGIGTAIMRSFDKFYKLVGAEPGDIHLIVASPDTTMDVAKQDAWLNFVDALCKELHGVPILGAKGGCWTIIY